MYKPLIAIAGSADPKRSDYEPPMHDCDSAKAAAEQVGAELARAGCRIMVYSSSPDYIEASVVRGFTAAKSAAPHSIKVRFPIGSAAASFAEYQTYSDLFDFEGDPHPEWQASYYRSLRDVTGVILLGGARSVVITGHIALAYRIPLISVATFGGAAQRVWQAIVPGKDLPSKEEADIMARPHWSDTSAAACVHALLAQHERRQLELHAERRTARERSRGIARRSLFAGVLFILTLTTMVLGMWTVETRLWVFQALLFFSGAIAGASGATLRLLWTNDNDAAALRAGVLGLASGGISAILYLIAQIAANPAAFGVKTAIAAAPSQPALLVFAVAIGFIGGFTSDAVYRKLAQTDVVQTEAIAAKRAIQS